MTQHKAAFLDEKGAKFTVRSTDTKSPGANEILIETKAIAINPVDWKVQDSGLFIKDYPAVLGEDVAGVVTQVGSSVNSFQRGDRVIAHSVFLSNQETQYGGFQEIVCAPADQVALIPQDIDFKDAAVLPLAISTAATGLYASNEDSCLNLSLPVPADGGRAGEKQTEQTLLIWGGSSSVGSAAIQLARASGIKVVTTCSKRNFEFVESLGAKAFDYNSLSIVGDLVAELNKGKFVGAYDCIGTRESSMQTGQVVAQFGGGYMPSVLPPAEELPATVRSAFVFALAIFQKENGKVGKAIWADFLPAALKNGQIIPAPPAQVIGQGVESTEEACQKQKAGVSAKKIVVTF